MAIIKSIFKIFNGKDWDEYHHRTDSAQVVHTDVKGNETTVEEILRGTDWVPVVLQNGAKTTTNTATKLSVKKHGNIVYLRGNLVISSISASAGMIIGRIQEDFRPPAHFRFIASRYDLRFGVIGISSDGTMILTHDTNITEANKTYYINTSWLVS